MRIDVLIYEIVHALRGDRDVDLAGHAVARLARQGEWRRVVVGRLECELAAWTPRRHP